jgi:MFS family permease
VSVSDSAATGTASSASAFGQDVVFSQRYRNYALGLLLVVYVSNFIDRSILTILLEPIRQEFNPSDTALGFLSGIAFGIFYATLGLPIARWADRGSRRNIIALALTAWSVMSALCGLVQSFTQLVIARIGVGVGEAGCSPPAHSLIADFFPPERRGTALSIYALGIPIGSAFGLAFGGWIAQFFGWRMAFLVVGLPGLLLALVVRFTLREPPRGLSEPASADPRPPPPIGQVMRYMWSLKSFRHLSIAAALHGFVGYGVGAWNGAFFIRSHHLGLGEIGSYLALIGITAGALGTFSGGNLGDRLAPRDLRWYLWVPGIATIVAVPFSFGVYLSPGYTGALLFALLPTMLGAMWLGPTFSLTQGLAPLRMRALASAFMLFVLNIIGLGLGPWGVGILSDLLSDAYGEESLRYALLATAMINVWSALHYFLASRTLRADLARAGS